MLILKINIDIFHVEVYRKNAAMKKRNKTAPSGYRVLALPQAWHLYTELNEGIPFFVPHKSVNFTPCSF